MDIHYFKAHQLHGMFIHMTVYVWPLGRLSPDRLDSPVAHLGFLVNDTDQGVTDEIIAKLTWQLIWIDIFWCDGIDMDWYGLIWISLDIFWWINEKLRMPCVVSISSHFLKWCRYLNPWRPNISPRCWPSTIRGQKRWSTNWPPASLPPSRYLGKTWPSWTLFTPAKWFHISSCQCKATSHL